MAWTMFQQLLTLRKELGKCRSNWCKSKRYQKRCGKQPKVLASPSEVPLVLLELRKRNSPCVAAYPRKAYASMSSCFFLLLNVIFNILRSFCSTGTVALSKLFQRDCASMVDLRDSPRASTSIAIIVTLLQLDYNYNNAV